MADKIFKQKTRHFWDNGKDVKITLKYKITPEGEFNIQIPAPVGFIRKTSFGAKGAIADQLKNSVSLQYMSSPSLYELEGKVERWISEWEKGRNKTTKIILYKLCYFGDDRYDKHTNYGKLISMDKQDHSCNRMRHEKFGVGLTLNYKIAYMQSYKFEGMDFENEKYYSNATCEMSEHIGSERDGNYQAMVWTEEKEQWFKEQEYILRQLMKSSYEHLNVSPKELEMQIQSSLPLLTMNPQK
tara:strand:+ start:1588 stop:2313 length:726 start_codon:yes stop_codon:yes gene_type:complete